MNRDETRKGCAILLKNLRKKHGLSKSKMAQMIYVDDHTWSKYETGQSSPSVQDFMYVFDALGEDALRDVLDLIYPETYKSLNDQSDTEQIRAAVAHFIEHVAPDKTVRQFAYGVFGKSGSNYVPRMNELCMIEHLPMSYKVIVAKMVVDLYEMAQREGTLVGMDRVLPDIDVVKMAISQGEAAVSQGRQSYTTIMRGDGNG